MKTFGNIFISFLSTVSSLGDASNAQQPATAVTLNAKRSAAAATPPDCQNQFNDLCAANFQRPRDVEENSAAARTTSKSMHLSVF